MHLRIFVPWIVLAAVLGFALGGSFFACVVNDCQRQGKDETTERHHAGAAPSQQTQAAPKENEEHPNRDFWGPEWSLVWVTIPLTLFTGALFAVTWLLARDARNIARSEFLASHRPRLRVRYFKVIGGPNAQAAIVRFAVVNIGDTIATNIRCRATAEYFDTKASLPPFMTITLRLLNCPLQLRRGEEAEVDLIFPSDTDLMGRMIAQGWALHAFGLVDYANEDGSSQWATAFCRKEDAVSMRMTPSADPDYEYED